LKNGSHKVIPNASLQKSFFFAFKSSLSRTNGQKYETQNLIYHFSVSKQNFYIHGVTLQIAAMCAPVEACALVAAAGVYKQGAEMLSLFESD
jgi:hypothetical protein